MTAGVPALVTGTYAGAAGLEAVCNATVLITPSSPAATAAGTQRGIRTMRAAGGTTDSAAATIVRRA